MKRFVLFLVIVPLLLCAGTELSAGTDSAASVAEQWRRSAAESSIEKVRTVSGIYFKSKGKADKRFAAAYETAERYGLVLMAQPCDISRHKAMKDEYDWGWPAAADSEAVGITVDRFQRALARYPREYVGAVGLKAVIFVRNLRFRGYPVGGGYDRRDGVVIIPIEMHTFPEFIEYVFNHEFFHLMQVRYHATGILSREKWELLLAPGTNYNAGGAMSFVKGEQNAMVEHPSPGLVTGYAGSDYMHDQTELFCHLMIPGRSARLAEWQKTDEYLVKKEAFIKNVMNEIAADFTPAVFSSIRKEGIALAGDTSIAWTVDKDELKITAVNVRVSGLNGASVYPFVQLFEIIASASSPVFYQTVAMKSDNHLISLMTFSVKLGELRKKFGSGEKAIKLRFGVASGPGKVVEGTLREIGMKIKL